MITKKLFEVYNGKELYAYTISDSIQVTVLTLGATVTSILVPSNTGELVDVALGMKDAESLLNSGSYMGAVVGRCANRIAGGVFRLGGKQYQVTQNDGVNSLHGGDSGFNTKVFEVTAVDERANSVVLRAVLQHFEDGYPANLALQVKYTVKENSLIIDYLAKSNNDTLCNVTNHTYFNLNGEGNGNALDNMLQINAENYLKVDESLIPTKPSSVRGTPLDFRRVKPIGKDMRLDFSQLNNAKGYDHCFCLDGEHAATAYSTKTGVQLDVYTDMPGLQFYSGNFLNGQVGKSVYGKHAGFCLETEYYPNAINRTDCAKPILRKGEQFHSQTRYVFSTRRQS